MAKKVSIIVLNWNGKEFLRKCLDSLRKINYPSLEVIVVDNNSTDGSQKLVEDNFPKVKIIKNKNNFGFAKGNNTGFKNSTGDYILFLNNDTIVDPEFLEILVANLEKNPQIGCLQPQLRVMSNKKILDEMGSFMTTTGFLYHFGYRKKWNNKNYMSKKEIFSAKGACILIPRKVLDKVGLFDEDFFIFFEETDLCFRIWLAGYKVMYEPNSVVYHVVGGDTSASNKYDYERRVYLTFKNMNLSYLKNFGTLNLITVFPFFISAQLSILLYSLIRLHFRTVRGIIRAYLWNLTNFSKTLKKRKIVQYRIRKVSDMEVNKYIKLSPRLSYYYYSLFKTTQLYYD